MLDSVRSHAVCDKGTGLGLSDMRADQDRVYDDRGAGR